MASGLLSLKWNNHRTTFFHVLSTIRSKESYCDATIACDGKFYPVHKLVLSTCSDYFEQMFERTNCKHPIIVLKDIRHEDLEALLNYMYVGEVNVLQNELAGLIKAAECLMIKGLAVPDEAPTKESKRSSGSGKEDSPIAKRRKKDDEPRLSTTSVNQHVQRETRESPNVTSTQSQRHSASASIPTPSPTVSRTAPPPISPSPSIGSVSDAVSEDCSQGQNESDLPALSNAQDPKHGSGEQASSQSQQAVPEVILDEPGVKEEPQEVEEEVTETKEIIESQFSFDPLTESDSRTEAGGGGGNSSGSTGAPGYDPQIMGSQPQSMEELVAQAIPGSSGLQGNSVSLWEGDGSLQGFPMEGYSGDGSRPPQMGGAVAAVAAALRVCSVCGKMGFRRTYDLQRHMLSHAAVRPFQCPHCPYRAALKYNLDAHIRLKHPEEAQSVQRNRDPGFTSGNLTGSVAQGALQQQSCETSDNGNSFIQVE
ncbi:longitudinals lacking protein, isoforms H/M/V-like isoform X8 [Penaeus chinensis]|uniref:longitudinals lacking protein, isoforms H/M/V-like isoform X8 n=1 Tax=Penaeus chinensis TaxID=139456 RepID=UPI001FB7DD0D|nr:longitudinals lacking protein, isoforms H/M/V-like isoform X8 [Penaeus chinensis]XP_047478177.1 longitudinals lacking protein, isoforms H/M/V-like isoform X8 [Penaeus chinensis]